jgi:P27 family predicted phage terminase small subunit
MLQRGRKSSASRAQLAAVPSASNHSPFATHADPPHHLGKAEQEIWRDVLHDYEINSQTSLAVLRTALEAHQRARECREAIKREGLTIVGRDGQAKAHPLLAVERDARQAWLAALRVLGLEL